MSQDGMPRDAAGRRFGDLSLQNLLKPEVFQKVFSDDPAKRP
jgi:hypothetical protein